MFHDPIEKKIFFRNFSITLCGFILAVVIQMFVVLDSYEPNYIFIPLIVGILVGSLFGYNGVLRRRLNLSNQAKSDFLSRMSHEFRTPLTSIIGFSQIVQNKSSLDEESKRQVSWIFHSGHHLLGLVEDLLEFARLEAGRIKLNIEPIGSHELIAECINMIEPLAEERHIQIDNKIMHQESVMLQVDPIRGRQVIMNLLSNAVKYNKEHGKIIISSEVTGSDKLRINVEDTGIGIAEENFPLIFDYFHRLDSEVENIEGIGIGLAIAKQVAEMMQGQIGVESCIGEGSTFWVEWPLA